MLKAWSKIPFVFLLALLLLSSVTGLVDSAENLNLVSSSTNIQVFPNEATSDFQYADDNFRFARAEAAPGDLQYALPGGIQSVELKVLAFKASTEGDWTLAVSAGSAANVTITAVQIRQKLQESGNGSAEEEDATFNYVFIPDGDWLSGTLTLIVPGEECATDLKIDITGSAPHENIQIGEVRITERPDPSICSDECAQSSLEEDACDGKTPETEVLRTFYDGASNVNPLYQSQNVIIAQNDASSFSGDDGRLSRRSADRPGVITYRFDEGGIHKVRVSVALQLSSNDALPLVNVTVRPYNSAKCKTLPYETNFSELTLHSMANNWQFVEVEYTVGPLPGLQCELAKFVEIAFFAPDGSDIQLMSLKLIGDGSIEGLQELDNPGDNPNDDKPFLEDSMLIYILVGVGVVLIIILVVFIWCCCLTSVTSMCCFCCGGSGKSRSHSMDEGEHAKLAAANVQMSGQVVIPVDCVVPDMAASMEDDSGQLHTMGQKFSTGYTAARPDSRDGRKMSQNGMNYAPEPVVDLSIPMHMHHQQEYNMGAAFAPRQDIFDTWQQTGLSDYQSGEDYEASGPLDTRERSFTGNPAVSSAGNTSPTQESSVIGVTAQLGMRLKELKSLQGKHERMAKGQADSNGDFGAAPEPLGVKYGRKIGVGGFGAVYEGEWAGKTVAIKVIKMPHSAKQSEDKEKMAFMEYAISGILLHDNIVQTYQADIRPMFLEDDTATSTVSKSGWTGLGEFLSNDAISQQMHKSMRIQEWELRLVMEYCNKGNLKEAIRQKSLMVRGGVKALDVAMLALDIAKACQAIHKHNIIHGDLKPHNVLLTADPDDERGWCGKIADFGLSVKIKRGEQHVSGIQHGTEGYVAPEVLQTRRMVKASDVYSFGIIMWEMWHARLYYEEYRHAQRRMRRVTLDFRPTFERGCPEEWANLAKSCWSLRPEERPDFDRVVKMMRLIISSLREKINDEGVITENY